LAADATGQMAYAVSIAHKNICLQVAQRAPLSKRKAWLGSVYDALARQKWADLSMASESFDVNAAATRLDEVLLRQAEAMFDASQETSKQYPQRGAKGDKGSSSGGKGNSWQSGNQWGKRHSGNSWGSSQPSKRGKW